jgi:hypothetical protein
VGLGDLCDQEKGWSIRGEGIAEALRVCALLPAGLGLLSYGGAGCFLSVLSGLACVVGLGISVCTIKVDIFSCGSGVAICTRAYRPGTAGHLMDSRLQCPSFLSWSVMNFFFRWSYKWLIFFLVLSEALALQEKKIQVRAG